MNRKTVLLGCGFMARAIAGGLIKNGVCTPESVTAVNSHNPASAEKFAAEFGCSAASPEALGGAEIVIIAFKPQSFREAMPEYAKHLTPRQLVISIMAGIRLADIEAVLPEGVPVIRAMPNLALSVELGATGFARGKNASDADCAACKEIFGALGSVCEVKESDISGVTAVSGSGGAYFYLLAESMEAAAVAAGMDEESARALTKQTFIGFAELWSREDEPASEMRRRITSAKGTTDAAIRTMQAEGFSEAVAKGMAACRARSDEIADEMSK